MCLKIMKKKSNGNEIEFPIEWRKNDIQSPATVLRLKVAEILDNFCPLGPMQLGASDITRNYKTWKMLSILDNCNSSTREKMYQAKGTWGLHNRQPNDHLRSA
jgi:hypothetical protein